MANTPFSLRLDTDVKERLKQEAKLEGRTESSLAATAIQNYLRVRAYKRSAIDDAVALAEEGNFISQEKMGAWVDSWGSDNELEIPTADIHLKP